MREILIRPNKNMGDRLSNEQLKIETKRNTNAFLNSDKKT